MALNLNIYKQKKKFHQRYIRLILLNLLLLYVY